MKDKLLRVAKALYAIPTVYRLVWTSAQLGAGAATAIVFDNPTLGFAVAIIATAVSSIARERLAKTS